MRRNSYFAILIGVLFVINISAQNLDLQSIEFDYNDNSIGRSVQLQLQVNTGLLSSSIGLRYQFKTPLAYNGGAVFYKTMHPIKFIQRFGPVFSVTYNYHPKKMFASFFAGYKAEVGIMARRMLRLADVATRTPTFYHRKSPMVRWENQLILGSSMPIARKINFRIYGGVGIAGIFRVFEENTIFIGLINGRDYEFSASFGCGLSYKLFGKNELKVN